MYPKIHYQLNQLCIRIEYSYDCDKNMIEKSKILIEVYSGAQIFIIRVNYSNIREAR